MNDVSTSPTLSVVIPLFNGATSIERCVNSVLRQFPPANEIIIVDDGSTDCGSELVERLYPQVRLLRQDNRGAGCARNTGVAAAACDWIAFVDADDYWLPGHTAELKSLALSFPESALISSHFSISDEATLSTKLGTRGATDGPINYFLTAVKGIRTVCSSSCAVRRGVLLDLGGFSSARVGEDVELWARIALKFPIAVSSKVTAVYDRRPTGTMGSYQVRRAGHATPGRGPEAGHALRPDTGSNAAPIATLSEALSRDPGRADAELIRAYMDRLVVAQIKESLVVGDWDAAKRDRALLTRLVRRDSAMPLLLLLLPRRTGWAVLQLRRRFRE